MILEKIRNRLIRGLLASPAVSTPGRPRIVGGVSLAPGAVLSEEAIVDNFHGGPENVVIGENTYCRNRFLTFGHGGRIQVGKWCYFGHWTEVWSMESIEIGDRVLISHGVNIHDGAGHSMDAVQRHQHFKDILASGHPKTPDRVPGLRSAPIVIEDDVWISFGVTVLKGVRIGRASVIAAGAIVTKDVPPECVYMNDVTPRIIPLSEYR